ncbi:MAG: dehydrogenase [Phycisphaeraceae bacterium]|nr:dehydrogenase [Phycisphaeraceae bacterium]
MAHKAVAFTAQQRAELIDIDDPPDLQPDEVRGRTLFSLISAGTELASYTRETSDPPQLTGYAAVAEVEAVGAEVENLAKGDMVFCGDHHKSFQQVPAWTTIRVPDGLEASKAVITRLMGVTFSTLITTVARPGDRVMITGLGPVGFLGTQIFRRSGYDVLACDPDERRVEYARRAGIEHVYTQVPLDDPRFAKTVNLVVECSGHEQAALDACNMVRVRGEVVLVGAPWERKADIQAFDLLRAVFNNFVVLRSGWEWEVPLDETFRFQHHTILKNYETAMQWLKQDSVYLDGLRDIVAPRDCQQAYQKCLTHETNGLFSIFDWSKR